MGSQKYLNWRKEACQLDFSRSKVFHKKYGIIETDHNTARGYFIDGEAFWYLTNRQDVEFTTGHELTAKTALRSVPIWARCEGELVNGAEVPVSFGLTMINIRVNGFSHFKPSGSVIVYSGANVLVQQNVNLAHPPTGPGWGQSMFEWIFWVGDFTFQFLIGSGYSVKLFIRHWGWPMFCLSALCLNQEPANSST